MKSKAFRVALVAVCGAVVVLGAGTMGFYFGRDSVDVGAATAAMEATIAQAPDMGSIAIPGFDRLTLAAGEMEQTVAFYNPEKNECYFVLTMYLPDMTEIYHSSKLAPGESLESIVLPGPLEEGVYEGATLRYACYSFDDLQPLNGADVNFVLEVTP
jgi:hypothetical protein